MNAPLKPLFYLPDDSQHTVILGRTGSGKTVAACWHLSLRSFDRMPWIVFDTKGDGLIAAIGKIEAVNHIDLNATPSKPGLYIVRALPNQEDEINAFLSRVWARGRSGLYFDEGFMIGKTEYLDAILTQGRSKRIPIILLSQRPAWLSRFAFSEASFFQIFWLTDDRDRKTVQSFVPFDMQERLPEFQSRWYDVKRDKVTIFAPVPPEDEIVETFKRRLEPKRRFL